MPIDATDPGSPGWWMKRLLAKLGERRAGYDRLDLYYSGLAGVPALATREITQSYQRLMSMARTNFAELVVEAVRERMQPVGFRTGAADDDLGDQEAWRIWQASALDADSALVHRSMLSMSDAYVIVGSVDDEIGAPLITPEDPREVYAEADPRRRRKSIAAVKLFRDDIAGVDRCYLYLPGQVWRAVRTAHQDVTPSTEIAGFEWQSAETLPENVVPVVRFTNQPDMAGNGRAEFESQIPTLDRISYSLLSRLEIATLQAFRQRAVKGVPNVDAEGNEVDYDDIFRSSPGALWVLPATAEMWESGTVDLGPLRQAIRDDVQDLAAGSRTPLFYLTPDATNGSAEGAALAREGLVFKTQDRLTQAGESWEQVMSLAFLFAGDTERARRADMEIIWADPQRFSLSERADAATKAQAGGMPWRSVMSDIWQKSPQEIERMEGERATDALYATAPPSDAPAA